MHEKADGDVKRHRGEARGRKRQGEREREKGRVKGERE